MVLHWNTSEVILALVGGVFIGLATSIHYLVMGRVTGFSGIYYSLITYDKNSFFWKMSLMSCVMMASCIMFVIYGFKKEIVDQVYVFDRPIVLEQIGWIGAPLAGLLVGFGTKMGNGCTSGHGVCGLPRLSIRSIVAVGCFMGTGILVSTLKYYIIDDNRKPKIDQLIEDYDIFGYIFLAASVVIVVACFILQKAKDPSKMKDFFIASIVGFVFGIGLVISGMVKRSKIIGFLTLNSKWDPSLMFVMISAVGINFITFRLRKQPFWNTKFEVPTNTTIDFKLIAGACIFGAGWGIGGLCPGPAVALFPEFTIQIGIEFMIFLAAGQYAANYVVQMMEKKTQVGDGLLGK